MSQELLIKSFATMLEWEKWLEENHHSSSGLWVKFYKKNSGIESMKYPEAVEVALCYGWIDSQLKSFDEKAYLQKFTPRRPKSIWSKVNIKKIEKLLSEGKMKPAGLKEVEAAKKDGRWQQAYDPPSTMETPPDLLAALEKNKKAKAFYETLNRTNTYAIKWRLQTAKKPETRQKRLDVILKMLDEHQKFY